MLKLRPAELYELRGAEIGHDLNDSLRAETEIAGTIGGTANR